MAHVTFLGGPHDGLELATGLGAVFLFTDGSRCFRAPRVGRALYKSVRRRGAERAYMFVGHKYVLCVCGVFRRRGRSCRMCGSTNVAA